MRRYVLVNGRFAHPSSEVRERLQAVSGEFALMFGGDSDALGEVIESVEVACGGIPDALVSSAHLLKWVQLQGAGAEGALRRYGRIPGIIITNASGVHGAPIAEHLLALILAFARQLHKSIRNQTRSVWDRSIGEGFFELGGKRVFVAGLGAIGLAFAERAAALGMTVTGLRRQPAADPPAGVSKLFRPEELAAAVSDADFIVNVLPYTPETRGMFDGVVFAAMKSTAIFLNAGRGKTVDEAALIEALRSGRLAGAGLDVFADEPLPGDSPLWTMEQVIVTPHIAGLSPRYDERLLDIFCENLRRYVRGETLMNVVDPSLGY